MRFHFLCAAIVLLGVAARAHVQTADDRASVEKLIKSSLDAIGHNDLDAALACWASDTPKEQLDNFRQTFLIYSTIHYDNLRFSGWTWTPHVQVRVRFDFSPVDNRGNNSADRIITVKNENGHWRLVRGAETVDVVAQNLFQVQDANERGDFLRKDDVLHAAGLLDRLILNATSDQVPTQAVRGQKWLNIAEEVADHLGDGKSLGLLWLGKGKHQMEKGGFAEAERCFDKSREVCQLADDTDGEFRARFELYKLFWQLRRVKSAETEARHIVESWNPDDPVTLPFYLERAYHNLRTNTIESRGRALLLVNGILDRARKHSNRQIEIEALKIRGLALALGTKFVDSQADLELGQRLAQRMNWVDKSVEIQCHLGWVRVRAAQFMEERGTPDDVRVSKALIEEAGKTLSQALAAAEAGNYAALQFRAQVNIGHLFRAKRDYLAAVDAYEKADDLIDRFRAEMADPWTRILFEDEFHGSYFFDAVSCCREAARGRDPSSQARAEDLARGFQLSERSRSRTLADLMADNHFFLSDLDAEHKAELSKRRLAIVQALAHVSAVTPDKQYPLKQAVGQAKQEYEDFLRKLFHDNPDLKLRSGRFAAVSLEHLGKTLLKPFPKTAVLSYLVGTDETLLVVLTWDERADKPKVDIHSIAVGRQALEERVNEKLRHYINIQARDLDKWAAQLYEDLVLPAAPSLQGKEHLVILADEVLNILPFAALRGPDGKYLVEHYSISYAPSATILCRIMQQDKRVQAAADLAALVLGCPSAPGDAPPIPFTENEARIVAKAFDTKAYVKTEATAALVKDKLEKASYIHLAVHGSFNAAKPLYSAVILARSGAEDGYLHAHDLLGMKFQGRLVVLSACQTAAPPPEETDALQLMIDKGEGVVGLSWALFAANSPCHLLTLGNVVDGSSSLLMECFYRELAPKAPTWEGQISKAAALQRAQLQLLRSKDYCHPSYWAPYVLHGDFRP
jgi:CHAT domain-containing protein